MADKGVGEAASDFTTYHFPYPSSSSKPVPMKPINDNPFIELKECDELSENQIAERFIAAVNVNDLVPGLKMKYCGNKPGSATCDEDRQKVDAAFYRTAFTPNDNGPHWGDQLITCEFKVEKRGSLLQDPFDDVPGGVSPANSSDIRKKNRGQIISYAELIFAVQQRIAVFMLLVLGRKCRFIRWDRSGYVVTRAFDYYVQWKFFVSVLWRMSQCSDTRLGLDPTAHRLRPGDADYARMTKAAKIQASDIDHKERPLSDDEVPKGSFVFKYVREAFIESVKDESWPRYRVEVPDGEKTRTFLIGKPTFQAKGLAGRGTRGYVALDCDAKDARFVWLKDAWRAHYLLVDREGDILARLQKAEVPNIPTLVCHGDIGEQVTYTPQLWEQKNSKTSLDPTLDATDPLSNVAGPSSSSGQKRKFDADEDKGDISPPKGLSKLPFRPECPLRLHKHYRLVVEEVALHLREFKFGRQLISVVKDCVVAHYNAYEKLSLLHRDVSGGNVLIYPRLVKNAKGGFMIAFTGILADWEMAKETTITGPRQPVRTGTWQYMSVALLSGDKDVEVCDELESFLYVLLYYATRYLVSPLPGITIANYLDEFFDKYGLGVGRYVCGDKKKNTIATGRLEVAHTVVLRFNSNMDDVLADLLSWFKAHYVVTLHEANEAALRSAEPTPRTSTGDLKSDAALTTAGSRTVPRRSLPRSKSTKLDGPSNEDREMARCASDHTAVVALLEDAERAIGWSFNDRAGDRIPTDWRPDEEEDDLDRTYISATGTASNKKLKTDGTLPLSLGQLRPPKTPSPPPSPPGPTTLF
ncbi:hypothetical protein L226DRAFT_481758 [Lentinus tigrinus ALCF2SS1-7]|uniref:Protein kinase domain-containing protein n=1 Tax=Lentinus tigrinus ALCF2SS1-6 TaxID=1328759 RepID=A0A5C2S8A1_9APHY|nr:hypothetical protein L227DRAFT_530209 [Lentinus tigrinus ALCF2SS1-6]RPD78771.1 hypothetical protein L226DRAFT_481758 [Lentinus tigrinus ALCF2SS1-7]